MFTGVPIFTDDSELEGEDGRGEGTRGGRWGEGEAKTINILRGTAQKLKHLEIKTDSPSRCSSDKILIFSKNWQILYLLFTSKNNRPK